MPNHRLAHALIVTSLFALLTACDKFASTPPITVVVTVSSADPTNAQTTANILLKRLTDVQTRLNSKASVQRDGKTLRFTLKNYDPPSEDFMNKLLTARGLVRVYLKNDPSVVWFIDEDIRDAKLVDDNGQPALAIHVKGETGQRLARLSADHAGKVLVTAVDGKVIHEAAIAGTFSNYVLLKGENIDAKLLAAVLSHGAIPLRVTGVKIE